MQPAGPERPAQQDKGLESFKQHIFTYPQRNRERAPGHFLIIDDGTLFFTVAGAGSKEKTQKRSKGLAPAVAAACEASPSRCRSPKSPGKEEKHEAKQCHFLLIEYNFGGCFPR